LPDFFEQRFEDNTHLIRIITGVFILLFFTFYTASGLVAGGKLFQSVFGFPYILAVAAGALVIITYTFMGGFIAVSWTDAVQATLMFGALIAVPVAAILKLGGWAAATGALAARNPALLNPFTSSNGDPLTLVAILSLMGWGLGYFGQPHILARFMAIREPRKMPSARRTAMMWVGFGLTGAVLAGITGVGALPNTLTGANTEKVFMVLVGMLFHPAVAGICLAAILAAIMSTADSQLLVASSALTHDFYKVVIRPGAGRGELLWVGRLGVVAVATVAFFLALNPESKVLDLVAYAWAGFGAAFGPTVIMSLFWRRMTRNGAIAGILTGGISVIVWKQLSGGLFDMYEIIPGFLFSLIMIVVASLAGRAPEEGSETLGYFDFVNGCNFDSD
jgi:sodium/proline symporter